MYIFGRKVYLMMNVIESTLTISLKNFHLDKYQYIEIDVYAMFKVNYGLNIIHSTIFTHQVGWFDGKRVDIYPWGLRIQNSQVT